MSELEIISWNVNSVVARAENIISFVEKYKPAVLLLQEIKRVEEQFPYEMFRDMGYNIEVLGQKAYNGVAIMSRNVLEDVLCNPFVDDGEARYIEASTYTDNNECVRIASVYVPNGREVKSDYFKKKIYFLEKLSEHLRGREYDRFVIGGDFNVAPDIADVYDPDTLSKSVGFHIEERDALRQLINDNNMLDIWRIMDPNAVGEYSWWDYRTNGFAHNRGMRIDNILVSPYVADMINSARIYRDVRGWKRPSDHVPISIVIGEKRG